MKGSHTHYDKRQKSQAPMRGQHFIVSDIQNLVWKEKAKRTSDWPLDKAACEIHDCGQDRINAGQTHYCQLLPSLVARLLVHWVLGMPDMRLPISSAK